MPLYEHVYLARQDLSTQQVEELTATAVRRHHRGGRQDHQDRILGPQVAHLPHPQEPQGALDAAQRRRAAGGAQRNRAPGAAQRRRAALSHHPRRRARGRPLGDDAQVRPRRSRRSRRPRRPWRSRTRRTPPAARRRRRRRSTSQRWRNRPWHSDHPKVAAVVAAAAPPAVLPPAQDLPVLRRQCAEDRLQGRQAVAALRVGARQDRAEPHHRGVGQEAARTGAGDQTLALPRLAALRDRNAKRRGYAKNEACGDHPASRWLGRTCSVSNRSKERDSS